MRRRALWFMIALVVLAPARCFCVTATTTQTLKVTIAALAKLSVPSSGSLTKSGTTFSTFTSSVTMNYRARTTSSGSGSITVKATSDFTPAGGPSISSGALAYTCGGATLGTACASAMTVSTASSTNVVTLPASACTGGGGACSSSDPNTTTLSFTLTDNPTAATGTYQASLQFTASSL
jgi:hypothetical protein